MQSVDFMSRLTFLRNSLSFQLCYPLYIKRMEEKVFKTPRQQQHRTHGECKLRLLARGGSALKRTTISMVKKHQLHYKSRGLKFQGSKKQLLIPFRKKSVKKEAKRKCWNTRCNSGGRSAGPQCAERNKILPQQHLTPHKQLLKKLVSDKKHCTYGENTQR